MPITQAARRVARSVILAAAMALPGHAAVAQSVSINLAQGGGGQSLASNMVGILAITSMLAVAPGILVMGTVFTRLVVVLSMLRTALGPATVAAEYGDHQPRAVPHRLHHGARRSRPPTAMRCSR